MCISRLHMGDVLAVRLHYIIFILIKCIWNTLVYKETQIIIICCAPHATQFFGCFCFVFLSLFFFFSSSFFFFFFLSYEQKNCVL